MEKQWGQIQKETKLFGLKYRTNNDLVIRFMNDENGNMLDEKIEVCKRLILGEAPDEIENFYEVLDDMPVENGEEITNW